MWCRVKKWGEKSLIIIIIAMVTLAVGAIFYRAISVIVVFYEIGKEDLIRGEALNFISILVAISAAVGGWFVTYKYRQDEKIARYTDWIIAAFVFFAFLWTGLQLDWIGDTAKVTDVLSFAAIIVAAGTAIYGWRRADRVAQEGHERVVRHAHEERERKAKAECKIFYQKYEGAAGAAVTALVNLYLHKNNVIPELNKYSVQPDDTELRKHFKHVGKMTEVALLELPDMGDAHEHLSKVYQYSDKLGNLLSVALARVTNIRVQLENSMKRSENQKMERFKKSPHPTLLEHYALLNELAAVPGAFENIRKEAEESGFSTNIRDEVLIKLRQLFQNLYDIKFMPEDPAKSSDAFIEMFFLTKEEFRKIANEAQDQVINGMNSEHQI